MVTLGWRDAESSTIEARVRLTGPGAPFEVTQELVNGAMADVFVRRAPSLPSLLSAAALAYPDRIFLTFHDEEFSYPSFERKVKELAGRLSQRYGISKGDRVAIVGANSAGYALSFWATIFLGGIVAGLNGWWTTSELEDGIELVSPKLILGDAPRLARLSPVRPTRSAPVVTFDALRIMTESTTEAQLPDDIDEDDPAVILFTSGTTGRPKGATLSHRNFIHCGQVNRLQGAIAADPTAAPPEPKRQPSSISGGPFFHVSGALGLLNAPAAGARIVFPPPGKWDEVAHLRLTEQHRVAVWSGVPTQFWRLLQHSEFASFDLSSVEFAGGGGASFAPELVRQIRGRLPGVAVRIGYGMTESSGLGLGIDGDDLCDQTGAIGAPVPTCEVAVQRSDGSPTRADEVGEICLRHASVFLGYWRNSSATAEVLGPNGWYRTGDFGRVTDGVVFLESRIRDLIIRGGENIYPIEIEHRLAEHPDIADAAVVGIDHPTLGQEVKAFVVRRPGSVLSADAVRDWAAATLAAFKVPVCVEFIDELPYTVNGKVQKNLLKSSVSDQLPFG